MPQKMSESPRTNESQSHNRGRRTKFSEEQLQILNSSFNMENYPRDDMIVNLAQNTGLSVRTITVWFQNARQKLKRMESQKRITDDHENRSVELSKQGDIFPNQLHRFVYDSSLINGPFLQQCLEIAARNNQSTEESSGGKNNKDRRYRTPISTSQVNKLSEIFKQNPCPNSISLETISKEVNLQKKVVQVWFQNARAREKKLNKSPNSKDKTTPNESLESTCLSHLSFSDSDGHDSLSEESETIESLPDSIKTIISKLKKVNNNPTYHQIEVIGKTLNIKPKTIRHMIMKDAIKLKDENVDFCDVCHKPIHVAYKDHVCEDEHIKCLMKSQSNTQGVEMRIQNMQNCKIPSNMVLPISYLNPAFVGLLWNLNTMPQPDVQNLYNHLVSKLSSVLPDFVIQKVAERYLCNIHKEIFYSQKNEKLGDLLSSFDEYQQNFISSKIIKKYYNCRKCGNLFEDKRECENCIFDNFEMKSKMLKGVMVYKIGWSCSVCETVFEGHSDLKNHIITNHSFNL